MTHTHRLELHTPWRQVGTSVYDAADARVAMIGQSSRTIADAKRLGRLIAALPDLLKACQYLLESTWTAEVECGLQLAKEAIAKATGDAA